MARPSKPLSTKTTSIKFLCSYGGKILPRYPDCKLRYYGGQTRVIAVDQSISFSELLVKLGELCGMQVVLRCQLPTEDLDALVSITCDEDLVNLIEEYGVQPSSTSTKIRAFLTLSRKTSPPRSNHCVLQRVKAPEKRVLVMVRSLRCGKSCGNLLRYACENSSLMETIGNRL